MYIFDIVSVVYDLKNSFDLDSMISHLVHTFDLDSVVSDLDHTFDLESMISDLVAVEFVNAGAAADVPHTDDAVLTAADQPSRVTLHRDNHIHVTLHHQSQNSYHPRQQDKAGIVTNHKTSFIQYKTIKHSNISKITLILIALKFTHITHRKVACGIHYSGALITLGYVLEWDTY